MSKSLFKEKKTLQLYIDGCSTWQELETILNESLLVIKKRVKNNEKKDGSKRFKIKGSKSEIN